MATILEKTFALLDVEDAGEGEFTASLASIAPESKSDGDNEPGTFDGYLSTFGNVDVQGDFVRAGAFRRSLKRSKGRVPLLWQHDHTKPIGTLMLAEDEKGLRVEKGRINLGTSLGSDAYALLREGDVSKMSIGYETVKDRFDKDKNARELIEVNLWEGSIVTFPANDRATIDSVKSRLSQDLSSLIFARRGDPPADDEIEDLVSAFVDHFDTLREKNSRRRLENAFDWLLSHDVSPDVDRKAAAESHVAAAFDWLLMEN